MAYDKTISILIFDGDPNGRIMCELSNWNGRVYKLSRTNIADFGTRNDAVNTGVYFLLGKDGVMNDTIYIGEAERVYDRLKQHFKDNEYWNDCIVVISKDNHLNKAHVKYLENQFYNLAKDAGRSIVINNTIPTCSSISEYDIAMLNEFIDHTKLLINTLGNKSFEPVVALEKSIINEKEYFYIKAARGANAKGLIIPDGFAVLANSEIARTTVPSISPSIKIFRDKLFNEGIINKESFQFTKDYQFTSPSMAAAVVMGRNANGKAEWKNTNGDTISWIEEALMRI